MHLTKALAIPLAAVLALLTLVPSSNATTSLVAESGNFDVSSLIGWLICGIVIGGIISASRTRSTGSASK